MANPTTYFSWVMPNSADLVTDLPADFAVFGQGVDTSMQYLLGGTTGQVLSKTSGTNMAFTWINNDQGDITGVTAGTGISGGGTSGTVTVTNSMATAITTNGDVIYGTGSGTFARLGIGTTGQVLNVASGIPAWATPAGGGKVLQVVMGSTATATTTTSSSYQNTGLTVSITPSFATSKVLILVSQQGMQKPATNTQDGIDLQLVRDATALETICLSLGYTNSAVVNTLSASSSYLDSPATTSSTTYKTQFKSQNSGNTVTVQTNSTNSTIIALEIGA